jgi:thiol-disulfide isomerase/thioredoxin
MPDLTVPAVFAALVLLILLGQWVVQRRAQSMRGQVVPQALMAAFVADSPAMALDAESPHFASMNALIEFGSPNCSACRRMAPVLANLSAQYPGRVVHLSVLNHRALAQTLRIMGTPTLILIQNGQIADVFVGITPLARLAEQLKRRWPAIAPINIAAVSGDA